MSWDQALCTDQLPFSMQDLAFGYYILSFTLISINFVELNFVAYLLLFNKKK